MLRKELDKPSIDINLLNEVKEIIKYIEARLEDEEVYLEDEKVIFKNVEIGKEIDKKKKRLEEISKSEINILQFENYSCACSSTKVAMDIILSEIPYVDNITVEELTELIEEFVKLEQINIEYESYYLRLLEKSFGMSVSDYIFWPDSKGMSQDSDAAEIAKRIVEDSKHHVIYL